MRFVLSNKDLPAECNLPSQYRLMFTKQAVTTDYLLNGAFVYYSAHLMFFKH
jgi:hypothetical protein